MNNQETIKVQCDGGPVQEVPLAEYVRKREAGEIKDGPIRHKELSPELLANMKYLYQVVGYMISPTLEQWELGFMRDTHPENEVAIWHCIAEATEEYRADYPSQDKRIVVHELCKITAGSNTRHPVRRYWDRVLRRYTGTQDGQHRV